MVTLHALQDSGIIPAVIPLSKPATVGYGVVELIFLNVVVFLASVIGALRQVAELKEKSESVEELEKLEEAILVPTFRGQGHPLSFIAHFLHVPISGLCGMIAGSIFGISDFPAPFVKWIRRRKAGKAVGPFCCREIFSLDGENNEVPEMRK